MTKSDAAESTRTQYGLRADAIGLREVLFQSMTDMAPGAAIAASIPAGATFAGGALPLSVLFALIACVLCAFCIGELAKNIPSSGSLATYAAKGLHEAVGFLVAWGYVFVGLLISPLVLLQLGFTVAGTLHSEISGYPADLWWPWTIAGALIVLAAGFYGIRTSAGLGTILGIFEIGVFVVLGAFLIVHAGSDNTLSVFGTKYTPPDHRGISGVFAGSVFTVLAFGGFEGATPLAEEARDPRRTIRRAVIGATLLVGALYVFTTYAADVAFGPGKFSSFGPTEPSSWQGLARSLYGIFWLFVFLAVVNSTIANANAGVNVASRTAYAMGRIGAFPYWFARVHLRHRSPVIAILVTTAVTLAVSLGLGFGYDPSTAFFMVGTALVILLAAIYIVTSAACIGYYARRRRAEFRPVLHVVIPILAIAAFVPAWLTAAGIPAISFIPKLPAPISYAGPGVAAWMVIGLVYLIILYRVAPRRVSEIARVHMDEEPEPLPDRPVRA